MGVRRSWLSALLRASGVTLLVPIGLLATVAIAATVGGGRLGSVGQLVGGPELPRAQTQAGVRPATTPRRGREGATALPTVPRRPRSTRRDTTAARPRPRPGAGRTTSPGRPAQRPSSVSRPQTPTKVTRPPKTPTTPPPTTTAPPPPSTPTTPTETNPVRQIGKVVQDVVAPLPVLGRPVSDAVGTVIDLIAPPPKGASATP